MIIYIAGPMSGLPDSNYPAFHAAAAALRAAGHTVLNPAENPPPPKGHPNPWQYYMRLSVKQIADADAVVMLRGWEDSNGADIEHALAENLNLLRYFQVPHSGFESGWIWLQSDLHNMLRAECPKPWLR
jgi:hypothetical protein